MDTGSIIIGAVMIAFCLLPFILMSNNRKKNTKKFTENLISSSRNNNCVISESEYSGHFMIGIDTNNNELLFTDKYNEVFESKAIDLNNVTSCKLVRLMKSQDTTESVSLQFQLKGNANSENNLEFFNLNKQRGLDGEIQIVQKWEKIINDFLHVKN